MHPMTAAVLRAVLVTNVVLLVVVGVAYLVWAERPGGLLVTGSLWAASAVLLGLLPRLRDRA
jgi:protein-S-isoprenylcysteine O-methyltransferase Ste14